MEFPRVNLWGAPVEAENKDPIVLDHTIAPPPPPSIHAEDATTTSNTGIWYIAGAALVLGVLYAQGVTE